MRTLSEAMRAIRAKLAPEGWTAPESHVGVPFWALEVLMRHVERELERDNDQDDPSIVGPLGAWGRDGNGL